ncbi:hypothetical protein V9T40_004789 [Parthenolecanium corni]|uniref:Uncharacterized protein n=1 Tax=Parthenolecanium corni TaxID=536013 RepID=A0AAN9TEH8_9HEMI
MHVKWLPDGDGSDSNSLSQQQQSQHQQNQHQLSLQPNPQALLPNGHIFPPMSQLPPSHFASQQQGNNGGEGVYRQLQPQMNRAQDDAMVSYIFQRTHSDTAELSLQQHPALAPPPPQQPPPPPHIQSQQAPTAVPLSHVQGKFQALRWPPSNEQVADFARNDHQQLLYEAQLNGPARMFPSTGPPPPQLPQPHPPPPQLAILQQPVDLQQRSQTGKLFIVFTVGIGSINSECCFRKESTLQSPLRLFESSLTKYLDYGSSLINDGTKILQRDVLNT